MNAIMAELLTLAKKLNNRLEDSGTWDTTTTHSYVVPAGKRWFVFGGLFSTDVSATGQVTAFDISDEVIARLATASAASALYSWPNTTAATSVMSLVAGPLILDAGEYVKYVFGVAQSTAAYIDMLVLEVNV